MYLANTNCGIVAAASEAALSNLTSSKVIFIIFHRVPTISQNMFRLQGRKLDAEIFIFITCFLLHCVILPILCKQTNFEEISAFIELPSVDNFTG